LYLCTAMTGIDTLERDSELRKRYDDILKSGVNCRYIDRDMVVRTIANQPAPRFYISPKTAEQHVLRYYRGEVTNKNATTRAMIKDLVENYEILKAEMPNAYHYEIWDALILRPAKRFYLSEASIKSIVYGYTRPSQAYIRNYGG